MILLANAWAETAVYSVIAICAAACYIVWRLTGGKHWGEK